MNSCNTTNQIEPQRASEKKQASRYKSIESGCKFIQLQYRKFSLFTFLFETKFKYFIFIVFGVYACVNIFVITNNLKVDVPMLDAVPNESFLKKFLTNHQNLFDMGPVVTVAIMKSMSYFKKDTEYFVNELLGDAKSISRMKHDFQVTWLDDVNANIKLKSEFYEECRAPLSEKCINDTFQETVIEFDFYKDDVIFNNKNLPSSFKST